jgi:hypothetical protein
LAIVITSALQSTKPLIQRIPWVPSKRLKWSRNETDHLPHLVRGLKMLRAMSPVPHTFSDDNLTFTSLLHHTLQYPYKAYSICGSFMHTSGDSISQSIHSICQLIMKYNFCP